MEDVMEDETPARIDYPRNTQLRKKLKLLKAAGFSKSEREKLIQYGIVDDLKLSDLLRSQKRRISFVLNRATLITNEEMEAVQEAHLVGIGEDGADGTPARIDNYTKSQLRRKAKILKAAGFSQKEREALIRDGFVGLSLRSVFPAQVYRRGYYEYIKPREEPDRELYSGEFSRLFRGAISGLRDYFPMQIYKPNKSELGRPNERQAAFMTEGELYDYLHNMSEEDHIRHHRVNWNHFFRAIYNGLADFNRREIAMRDISQGWAFLKRRTRDHLTGKKTPLNRIYTESELRKQRRLLARAGFAEREIERIQSGEHLMISTEEYAKVLEYMRQRNSEDFLERMTDPLTRNEITIGVWKVQHNLSERAVIELMYQLREDLIIRRYTANMELVEYQEWVEKNTL